MRLSGQSRQDRRAQSCLLTVGGLAEEGGNRLLCALHLKAEVTTRQFQLRGEKNTLTRALTVQWAVVRPRLVRDAEERTPSCGEGRPVTQPGLALESQGRWFVFKRQIPVNEVGFGNFFFF